MRSRITLAVLAGIVVVALLGWVAWHGMWALRRATVEQQYRVNTGTQQYQMSLISQERDRADAISASTDGERVALVRTFCSVYPQIKMPTPDLTTDQGLYCTGGTR